MTLPRRPGPSRRVHVHEYAGGELRSREDRLATEEPLEIRIGWPGRVAERLSVTMRTPGHDFELTAGFLRAERLVVSDADIHTVAYCTDHALSPEETFNVVTAELSAPPARQPSQRYAGPGAASSACGVCGKQSIEEALDVPDMHDVDLAGTWSGVSVSPDVIAGLPDQLRAAQRVFERTGGIHAAGLFTADGTPVVVREDIGRHNAVDKVIGSQVLAGSSTMPPLLCVSGRIGFELVQKAVVAEVAVIAAVGAPSSLAVHLAAAAGLCTIGFVRGERFVVYSVPERVQCVAPPARNAAALGQPKPSGV